MASVKRQRGFSLLEVVVVVAVVLVVMAIAAPNITNTIYNIRLRGSASTVAGIMQKARMQAVQDNQFYYVRQAKINNVQTLWVSTSATSTAPATGEPQVQLGGNVSVVTSGLPSVLPLSFNPLSASQKPTFGSRGLPCYVSGGKCYSIFNFGTGAVQIGFQMYLADRRPVGSSGFAAVTISPAGRVQSWFWNGSSWGQ